MAEFNSTLYGKPAKVRVGDDGRVKVTCPSIERAWGFSADMKPDYYQNTVNGNVLEFTLQNGRFFSQAILYGERCTKREVEDGNAFLRTFAFALDSIAALPAARTTLPANVTEHLEAAYRLIGQEGPVTTR